MVSNEIPSSICLLVLLARFLGIKGVDIRSIGSIKDWVDDWEGGCWAGWVDGWEGVCWACWVDYWEGGCWASWSGDWGGGWVKDTEGLKVTVLWIGNILFSSLRLIFSVFEKFVRLTKGSRASLSKYQETYLHFNSMEYRAFILQNLIIIWSFYLKSIKYN